MPDIRESILIDAPAAKVSPLVSSGEGLSKWWAEDVVLRPECVDLGFFNRATVYSVQLVRSAPSETEWFCKSGKEWEGTRLRFQLTEAKGQTLLRFTHAGWEADTDYFVSCNTTWGALMFRLKALAEGNPTVPLFSKAGWAL
jgi:uncharacterized protein YndB with AHSA1/START domain